MIHKQGLTGWRLIQNSSGYRRKNQEFEEYPDRSITGAITARTRKSVRVLISTGNFKIFQLERSEIPEKKGGWGLMVFPYKEYESE
jgi:hypothetical protein